MRIVARHILISVQFIPPKMQERRRRRGDHCNFQGGKLWTPHDTPDETPAGMNWAAWCNQTALRPDNLQLQRGSGTTGLALMARAEGDPPQRI
jgi:hypothetical protein